MQALAMTNEQPQPDATEAQETPAVEDAASAIADIGKVIEEAKVAAEQGDSTPDDGVQLGDADAAEAIMEEVKESLKGVTTEAEAKPETQPEKKAEPKPDEKQETPTPPTPDPTSVAGTLNAAIEELESEYGAVASEPLKMAAAAIEKLEKKIEELQGGKREAPQVTPVEAANAFHDYLDGVARAEHVQKAIGADFATATKEQREARNWIGERASSYVAAAKLTGRSMKDEDAIALAIREKTKTGAGKPVDKKVIENRQAFRTDADGGSTKYVKGVSDNKTRPEQTPEQAGIAAVAAVLRNVTR